MSLPSLWTQTAQELPHFPALTHSLETEVLVVGAGITGLTAALLLQKAGKRVVVIDAGGVGAGETLRTTAHVTEALDTRYRKLSHTFGEAGARLAAESSRGAIDLIEQLAGGLSPAAGFRRVPAFLYAQDGEQKTNLQDELESLRRVGTSASWLDALPAPFECIGAVRIEAQGKLNPVEYLRSLLADFLLAGGRVFSHTAMVDIDDGEPCRATTPAGVIMAQQVFVATHAPTVNKVALHTKLAAYRTYALAYTGAEGFPEGLFWDMQEPYHYVRTQQIGAETYLVVGGEDHKTGTDSESERHLLRLSAFAESLEVRGKLVHGWSGQILEPNDGLPLIGKHPGSKHLYVATGFSGNGITFGTLSAMLVRDAILGVANPWAELYEPRRLKPFAKARFYSENIDYPATLARDRLSHAEARSADEIPRGAGRLMKSGRKMLAVYRDEAGRLHSRSATCTHLGCYVRWNPAEQTWDCPCHGSRFSPEGAVLNGPATRALEKVEEPSAERPSAPLSRH